MKKKKKKPNVSVYVDCPVCESRLHVDVYKQRINEPEPAEYDITTHVRVDIQGHLFPDDATTPGVQAEKASKKDVA